MISAGLDRPALLLLVLLASAAVRAIVFAGVAGLALAVFRVARTSVPALLLAARALRRRGDARAHRDSAARALALAGGGRYRALVVAGDATGDATDRTVQRRLSANTAAVGTDGDSNRAFMAIGTVRAVDRDPTRIAWHDGSLDGRGLRDLPARGRAALAAGRRRLEAHAPPRESRRANRHLMGDGTPAGAHRVARHDARAATARSRRARGAAHDVDRRSRDRAPRRLAHWSAATIDAVLAHELAHIERRDALTQRVTLVYLALFWFSPFSWWLHQHLAQLAEQASDEVALDSGAEFDPSTRKHCSASSHS